MEVEGAIKEVPFKLVPGGGVGISHGGCGGSEEELLRAERAASEEDLRQEAWHTWRSYRIIVTLEPLERMCEKSGEELGRPDYGRAL